MIITKRTTMILLLVSYIFIYVAAINAAAADDEISYILTAENTTFRLTPQQPLHFNKKSKDNNEIEESAQTKTNNNNNATTLKINQSITYQEIEGFGGAFTDSSTHVFDSMPSNLQDQLVEMYFGETGLKYNMGRLTIGSCDFSMEYYNYDDVKGDVNLTNFNISHDEEHIIPFIQRAIKAANVSIKFVASPWSAPAWMKKNNHMNCDLGPWTCVLKDDATIQQAWAQYFSKYIDSYKKNNINIWGITIQNEPEAQTGNIVYEGMHFTPDTEKAFLINHLGPVMESNHPDVNVLIYDHNKDHIVEWAQTILGDPKSAKYVWGTAFHWYTGPYFENLAKTHELFPKFKLLSTESTSARQKTGTYNVPEWKKGEHYGMEIIGDLNNWSVGFIDWNLLLDKFGAPSHADPTGGLCEKLVKCGSDSMVIYQDGKLYPQIFYYYMGHVSKYVPGGSVRIGLHASNENAVIATAMKTPDGKTVVIAMNPFDGPLDVTLEDPSHGVATTTLLPHSIATFVY